MLKWLKSILSKPTTAVVFIGAILTLIGVLINSAIGYVNAGMPIRATQTAEAKVTQINQTPATTPDNSVSIGGDNSGIIIQGSGGDITINQPPPTIMLTPTPIPVGGGSGKIFFIQQDINEKICGIYSVDTDGKNLTRLTGKPLISPDSCEANTNFAISPDGTKIAFSYFEKNGVPIFVMNSDGTEQRQLTYDNELSVYYGPNWSPDSKKLVAYNFMGKIFLIDVESASKTFLADGYAPTWSPRGDKIAFAKDNSLFVMNSDGSNINLLDSNLVGGMAWLPDGGNIAFVARYNNSDDIYVKNVDNDSPAKPITKGLGTAWGADFLGFSLTISPDGKVLAFPYLDSAGQQTIYLVDIDGRNFHQLINKSLSSFPAWSPDGKFICFVFFDDTVGSQIFTIKSDGSQATFITLSSSWALPAWQP